MKIHFHGAAGDVTRAAFQLTTEQASVLVDGGLYQGSRQATAQNRIESEHAIHAHCPELGETIEV